MPEKDTKSSLLSSDFSLLSQPLRELLDDEDDDDDDGSLFLSAAGQGRL